MKKILCAVLVVFGFVGFANAGEAPQPCGPKAQLTDDYSNNVGNDARCFELRIYTADPEAGNGIDELHQRFREEEVAIFEKHGAEVIGVWQHNEDANTLIWMLAYRDRAHRDEVWAGFLADPAWEALRTKYPAPLSGIEAFTMSSTDYSNLK